MEIRPATKEDLTRIMELGRTFGHQMLYQRDLELMERCLPRILVAVEGISDFQVPQVVGFYHYIISGDLGFEEMLRCYRQFPEDLIKEALPRDSSSWDPWGELCICMQGASHREVFTKFIKYLQERYPEIWCYCSVKSKRPETYEELGFLFDPKEKSTFWNVHKGDYSTYRLGRWKKAI